MSTVYGPHPKLTGVTHSTGITQGELWYGILEEELKYSQDVTKDNPNITEDPVVNSVIQKYQTRSNFGMKKYGVTMEANKGELLYWLKNLQEELFDASLYIERLMVELKEK